MHAYPYYLKNTASQLFLFLLYTISPIFQQSQNRTSFYLLSAPFSKDNTKQNKSGPGKTIHTVACSKKSKSKFQKISVTTHFQELQTIGNDSGNADTPRAHQNNHF
jgi:hypothetical protein